MNRFRNWMIGRYGGDQFGIFLLIVSFVASIVLMFVPIPLVGWLGWIPLVFAIYRMFSKQIEKRQKENYAFLRKWGAVRTWWWQLKSRIKDSKTHRFYKCPNCKQKLRVPKGKGKINITCTKCGTKFTKKT